ncbi:M23 family metallopeptidase [Actinoplanes sp. NPDC026670]|uniref:M23 family metallopeptidase n=1 Tax=Actinoplanes sp. NPDC026670 TaxID=3154700 RepID=UPI0033CE97E4
MRTRAVVAGGVVLVVLAAVGIWIVIRQVGGQLRLPLSSRTCTVQADGRVALDPDQMANAATIAAIGIQRKMPEQAVVVALATAYQESGLRNLAGGDRDSVGLFQQRPGWGSVRDRMTPTYAAGKFYEALLRVDGWQRMRLTDAAQAVQRSGLPEAYQKWEPDAEQLAARVLGLPSIDDIGGGAPTAPCGIDDLGPVPVGPGGWVQPIRAVVTSPFGQRNGRLHAGVDMSTSDVRGDPIRAASAGVVEQVKCDWHTTCDRDGHTGARGCGWYVDIRHAGNVVTRYCHMIERPEVSIGQRVAAGAVIGHVGNSGGSSGPHLHFEVHVGVRPGPYHANSSNAVDPEPWMRARGVPLGTRS